MGNFGYMVATWTAHVAKPTGAISMARPRKTDAPDLSERVNLTAGTIERLTCPDLSLIHI